MVIRTGDIDNLGFGFAEDFNPFTGRVTDAHGFPFDPARITTVGHGPDQPVAPNDTEENRALNRRVEMKVTRL